MVLRGKKGRWVSMACTRLAWGVCTQNDEARRKHRLTKVYSVLSSCGMMYSGSRFLFIFITKYPTAAATAITAAATPIPIPIFAPVDNPLPNVRIKT